jgi:hypothetical protein
MNRSQSTGWRRLLGTVALWAGGLALLCLATGAGEAHAYERYDDNLGKGGCVTCHGGFVRGPQGPLHAAHVNNLGITDCNFCHRDGPGSWPIYTYESGDLGPEGALGPGYGCAGCHGRDYGESSTDGKPKATGYGLRAFHARRGVTECDKCHGAGRLGSPDSLPDIFPEPVPPPYYGMPGSNLTDPCDSTQEAFTAIGAEKRPDVFGLDNDGNGLADFPLDPACALQILDRLGELLPVSP